MTTFNKDNNKMDQQNVIRSQATPYWPDEMNENSGSILTPMQNVFFSTTNDGLALPVMTDLTSEIRGSSSQIDKNSLQTLIHYNGHLMQPARIPLHVISNTDIPELPHYSFGYRNLPITTMLKNTNYTKTLRLTIQCRMSIATMSKS